MTEYGAPITTSETYCRDTARKATHSVLSAKPGLQGGREGPRSQLGQRAKGILRLLSRGQKLHQWGPTTCHPPYYSSDHSLTRQASTLRVRSCRFMMG